MHEIGVLAASAAAVVFGMAALVAALKKEPVASAVYAIASGVFLIASTVGQRA